MRRSICLSLLCLCSAVIQAADIQMDATNLSHPFEGFGAQIWPGDLRVESVLTSLNMKYVRMKFGGNWNPPTDATQAQMDTYVAGQYDGNTGIRNTYSILNQHNIAVIGNFFEGPSVWLGSGNSLKVEHLDDFARLWGSIAYYMQTNNMPIRYIEMFNEPEGDWNMYVPGSNYNTIVKLLRSELDSRGLTGVGIVGPGLAYLYHGPTWINALDSDAKAALECWSTHAWDEGWGHTDALPSFLDQRWQDYFGAAVNSADPDHTKLIIVTEYATGVRTYNGVTFGDEMGDTNQFAQRCYENSLTLINNGANILSYWEAANQSWQNPPMYGFLRVNSSYRPVYDAFLTLAPLIPDHAMVLQKTWNDSQISAAGFVGDNQLVMAFANSTADKVLRTVGVSGISSLILTSAQAFESGAIVDKFSEIDFDYESQSLAISLAPESTLTVVAQVNVCTGSITGDLNGDCRTNLGDFRILAADWLKDNRITGSDEVENYESYADSPELRAAYSTTANVTLSLETAAVHGGSKSMKFAFNNGADPYYSITRYTVPGAVMNVQGVDWNGYGSLSVWYNVESNGGDLLKIKINNYWGGELYTANFGNVQAGQGWQEAVIDLHANLTPEQLQQVGRVDLMMLAGSYASGVVYFDDIAVNNDSSICSEELAGDLCPDCVVNLSDVIMLSEHWLLNTLTE